MEQRHVLDGLFPCCEHHLWLVGLLRLFWKKTRISREVREMIGSCRIFVGCILVSTARAAYEYSYRFSLEAHFLFERNNEGFKVEIE